MGYEPVRHESGHVPYGKDQSPADFAYREIEYCEILVCVIGGKYGSPSGYGSYSITQKELKTALERGKQVYIFIDSNVYHEHKYWSANKNVPGVNFTAVDNTKIHEFIEEIYALPKGNPIFPFAVSSEITAILTEQWAGLFQRLLIENSMKPQTAMFDELQASLQTVSQLVEFLSDQKGKGDEAVHEILFANHPLFKALKDSFKNRYRVYFTTLAELDDWMQHGKLFTRIDEFLEEDDDYFEWTRTWKAQGRHEVWTLYLAKSLFKPSGELKPLNPGAWDESFLRYVVKDMNKKKVEEFDDDIPF